MKILNRPTSLRLLVTSLVIFPLFYLLLGTQILPLPWSEPFQLTNKVWLRWMVLLLTQVLIWMGLMRGIYCVNTLSLFLFGAIIFLTATLTGIFSLLHKSPQLALMCFLLFLGGITFWILIKREFRRSFFYHGKKWYQGRSEIIPQLQAKIFLTPTSSTGTLGPLEIAVANLSNDGFFGFCSFTDWKEFLKAQKGKTQWKGILELLGSKERVRTGAIAFEGTINALIEDEKNQNWVGFGVQFKHNPEQNMRVGDLMEILRSRGYVQNA